MLRNLRLASYYWVRVFYDPFSMFPSQKDAQLYLRMSLFIFHIESFGSIILLQDQSNTLCKVTLPLVLIHRIVYLRTNGAQIEIWKVIG